MKLFKYESGYPKNNAQLNLAGVSHYCDDDTLRYFRGRVLYAGHHDGGLLFSIVTSDSLDYQHKTRGFRYVIFDCFGTVLDRPDVEHAFKTRKAAEKAMYAALDKIDAKKHTMQAIKEQKKRVMQEFAWFADKVKGMKLD